MKIICVGLPRTGLSSLAAALQILGYRVEQAYFARPVSGADAVLDNFAVAHWQAMHSLWPDAKLILSTRSTESWLESWERHVNAVNISDDVKLMRIALYGQWKFDPVLWRNCKLVHENTVRYMFLGDQLLEFNVCGGDGWPKLANFLQRPVPTISFPHENRSDA